MSQHNNAQRYNVQPIISKPVVPIILMSHIMPLFIGARLAPNLNTCCIILIKILITPTALYFCAIITQAPKKSCTLIHQPRLQNIAVKFQNRHMKIISILHLNFYIRSAESTVKNKPCSFGIEFKLQQVWVIKVTVLPRHFQTSSSDCIVLFRCKYCQLKL